MEKLTNEFIVHRPIAEAWAVLTDLEQIAPCMPGAELTEIEGEVYRGMVKVKLGAISTNFKGQASFVERDDDNHRAVLKAEGRDTGGKGNANATITASLTPVDADSATCSVNTDLHVSGRVAQFGRGIMADVSKKLMAQFADNLNTMLVDPGRSTAEPSAKSSSKSSTKSSSKSSPAESSTGSSTAGSSTADTSTGSSTAETSSGSSTADSSTADTSSGSTSGSAGASSAAPTKRVINGPAAEPIDMTEVAGAAVLKRLVPVLGGLALLVLIWRVLRRR